jgi:hypothetical protein
MSPDFVPAVLIYSLGTYAFGAILFYGFVRPKVQMDCFGRGEDQSTRLAEWAGTAISVASFLWFIALLSLTLLRVVPDAPRWQLRVVVLFLQFAYPALIMTAVFADIQSPTPRLRSVAWRVPPIIAAVAGMAAFVWSILGFRGLIDVAGRTVGIVAGAITALLFAGCAVYSVIALKVANASIQRSNERGAKRQSMIGLYYYLLVMTFVMVLLAVSDVGWERLGVLVGTSMPLLFVSVAIYHEHRFAFFDLILKRGLALMLTIGATTGYLALMLPLLGRLSLEGRRAFVYAAAVHDRRGGQGVPLGPAACDRRAGARPPRRKWSVDDLRRPDENRPQAPGSAGTRFRVCARSAGVSRGGAGRRNSDGEAPEPDPVLQRGDRAPRLAGGGLCVHAGERPASTAQAGAGAVGA